MKAKYYFRPLLLPFFLLVFLGLVGGLTVLRMPFYDSNVNGKAKIFFDGSITQKIEHLYDDTNVIKTFAINLWSAIQYVIFNEGKKGVIVGREGWLFTSEEFYSDENIADYLTGNVQYIEEVNRIFLEGGIELVILIVPAKAEVYSEYLGRYKPSIAMSNFYSQVPVLLPKKNTVFLKDTFRKSPERVFLKTDTHWSPLGAKVAAELLSSRVKSLVDLKPYKKNYVSRNVSTEFIDGDLLKFVPISPYFDFLLGGDLISTPNIELSVQNESMDQDDLFMDEEFPLVLVGTSYSANTQWNFINQLKFALNVDIVNYSREGLGPFVPMLNYLESEDFNDFPPKLVIWEIPERYLAIKSDVSNRILALKKNSSSLNSVVNRGP